MQAPRLRSATLQLALHLRQDNLVPLLFRIKTSLGAYSSMFVSCMSYSVNCMVMLSADRRSIRGCQIRASSVAVLRSLEPWKRSHATVVAWNWRVYFKQHRATSSITTEPHLGQPEEFICCSSTDGVLGFLELGRRLKVSDRYCKVITWFGLPCAATIV